MLTELEFMDKKRIVLVKSDHTYVFDHGDGWWKISSIPVKTNKCLTIQSFYKEDDDFEEAYEFYKERMESFGFKPFPIIME